jgi:hypothetical protein
MVSARRTDFREPVMDPLAGINSYTPIVSYLNGTIFPTTSLLGSELSLATPEIFNNTRTIVNISSAGQLLSAVTNFQDQLRTLQPGTATSGGGQNFGTDFASLAAEAQSLADAYNSLQANIAGINGTSSLLGGSLVDSTGLAQSLGSQAQASYANGNSALTTLSQLGINYQPSPFAGAGGSLNIDLNKLQTAYNADSAGAFSLLSNAANAFSGLAGNFITQQGGQFSALAALLQTAGGTGSFADFLTSSLASQTQSSLSGLLSSGSQTGNANLGQVFLALNEYSVVSALFA